MPEQARPNIGMDVIDNADHMVGTVESVEPDHFIVEKGFFFPKSHVIPNSAIESISNNEITLRISRDEAINLSPDADLSSQPQNTERVPDSSDTTRSAMLGGVDPYKT